jgi:hypothetical protein
VKARLIAPGRVISDVYAFDEAQRAFESIDTARAKTWIRLLDQPDPA